MKKLFIVGCPRSGTTVLQQALNRHSQIVIPPETKFFYYFYGQSRRCQLAHLERLRADLEIDLPEPAGRIHRPCDARAYFDQIAERYLDRVGHNGVEYFGDKTPEHTGHLHRIREVFAEAKIIFLYRDGRDVALSLSRMPWLRCDPEVGMLVWLYYYGVLKRERAARRPVCWVRYEDLVRHPAAQLRRILEYLGLPYERQVAEGYGNREGIPPREYQWKAGALEPITTRYIGLWRQQLTARQIDRLERLGGAALRALGYDVSECALHGPNPALLLATASRAARCAVHLPLRCLLNECLGSVWRTAGRLLSHNARSDGGAIARPKQSAVHAADDPNPKREQGPFFVE